MGAGPRGRVGRRVTSRWVVVGVVVAIAGLLPSLPRQRATAAPVVHHILGTGQSLSQGLYATPALTLTQPYDNLMLGIGWQGSTLVYTGLAPLVEGGFPHDGETISSAMANALSVAMPGYRSIVTRHGVSGFAYDQLRKGTAPYADGMTQVATANRLLKAQGIAHVVDAVTVVHGEADQVPYGSPTPYEADLVQWQRDYSADVRAITGQTNDVVLFTDQVGSWHPTSAIPFAQLAAAEHNPGRIVLVGPKYFLPYAADADHLSNVAERTLGEYYAKAYRATVVDGVPWRPLAPEETTVCGAVVTARFHLPAGPLVVDTSAVSARTNLGFELADGTASPPTITDVAITDPDTVRIRLSRAPTGTDPRLRYAFTAPGGPGQAGLAAGNLRDSDAALPNWLVHFDRPLTTDCGGTTTTTSMAPDTTTTSTTTTSTTTTPTATTTTSADASTSTSTTGSTSTSPTTTSTVPATGATARIEAEAAALVGPSVVSWGAGYSGAGWITNWNNPGQSVTFTVTAAAAGPATLRIRYKAPFLPAVRALSVNGGPATSAAFSLTAIVGGDWTDWAAGADAIAAVSLAAGVNHVSLTRTGAGDGPLDLDVVEVETAGAPPTTTTTSATTTPASTSTTTTTTSTTTPTTGSTTTSVPTTTTTSATTTSVPGHPSLRLEAELAALEGPTVVTWGAGWSGTGWITAWNNPGQTASFTVTRATAGLVSVRVRYKAPFLPARRDLSIDGGPPVSLALPLTAIVGGDWTSWAGGADAVVAVTLPVGTSTITLRRATAADGPVDVDYLDIVG